MYMQEWRSAHRDELRSYQRAEVLRAAVAKQRFPLAKSIKRYGLTKDELAHIANVLGADAGRVRLCIGL